MSGGPAAVWGPLGTLRSLARKMRSLDRGHPDTQEVRSSAFQPRTWEEPQKDPETEKSRTLAAPALPVPSAGRPRSGDWLPVGRHTGTQLGLSAKPRQRMAWTRGGQGPLSTRPATAWEGPGLREGPMPDGPAFQGETRSPLGPAAPALRQGLPARSAPTPPGWTTRKRSSFLIRLL